MASTAASSESPLGNVGKPPPYWFARVCPFPVFIAPLRDDDCTAAHRRAVEAAGSVRTVLTALVALGQFDVGRFLARVDDSPDKYLDFLRGRHLLRGRNVETFSGAIVEMANNIAASQAPDRPIGRSERNWKTYYTVREIAVELNAPLLSTDLLYVEERHIESLLPTGGGAAQRRRQWATLWAEAVDHKARDLDMLMSCRCHAVQALFNEGVTGPPSDAAILKRGGHHHRRRTERLGH